jgi:hypothetical protein
VIVRTVAITLTQSLRTLAQGTIAFASALVVVAAQSVAAKPAHLSSTGKHYHVAELAVGLIAAAEAV